jgi:hypothetical protein
MSARDDLRAWVTARATDEADAAAASKLIAAFVAEAVREDRRKQRERAESARRIRQQFEDLVGKFRDATEKATA